VLSGREWYRVVRSPQPVAGTGAYQLLRPAETDEKLPDQGFDSPTDHPKLLQSQGC